MVFRFSRLTLTVTSTLDLPNGRCQAVFEKKIQANYTFFFSEHI